MQVEGDQYVDLAACLTAANRKQYHQVKKDGTPLCYAFTISSVNGNNSKTGKVATVANSWTTRNAVKMAAIGWKKQLSHAGVRIRDLPTSVNAHGLHTSLQGVRNILSPQARRFRD